MTKRNGNEPDLSVLKQWPVTSWDWPKVVVYVPMMQALPYADEVFPNFIEIARTGVPFMHLPYGFADRMRNEAAKQLLSSRRKFTHIVMLDADHTHPPDIVHRLAKHVIEDPDRLIVGGINFKRTEPFAPCAAIVEDDKVYRPQEWEAGIVRDGPGRYGLHHYC